MKYPGRRQERIQDMSSRLQQKIREGKPVVLVELPGNSIELASSAAEGGADSVIAQLNNEHPVTHAYTGGLELEYNQLKEMISAVGVPVGLHIGSQARLTKDDWEKISELGIDFIASSVITLPPYVLGQNNLQKIVYIPAGLPFEHYRTIGSFDSIIAISFEAMSQTQPDPQVKFNVLDVLNLDAVARLSAVPVFFRASQDLEEDDIHLLINRGCTGLIVDPGFTGATPEHFKMTTEFYKSAIAKVKLRPRFLGYSPWG